MTQEQTQAINDAFSFIAMISSKFMLGQQDFALQECKRHYTELRKLVGQDIADHFKYLAIDQIDEQLRISEQAERAYIHLSFVCDIANEFEPDPELCELNDKLREKLVRYFELD